MRNLLTIFLFFFSFSPFFPLATTKPGIEILLQNTSYLKQLRNKRVGIITNHTAVTQNLTRTQDLMKQYAKENGFKVVAFFAPEHGLKGHFHASEKIKNQKDEDGIPIFSLHGKTRRPTQEMLRGVDVLIFDIQDIGSRSYTYLSTLLYTMEEASKAGVQVIVCDRPNPINGEVVDGPMLQDKFRSFIGYINVPYVHGMTIGELARYFNEEYQVGCKLTVIPMKGWKRSMTFEETGLPWVPTSPNIPEPTTPLSSSGRCL